MTLSLMLPLALAALASLVLPVLVHLARRSEQRVVVFAALRWLQARPQPRRKHRLDEIPLLLLRLLMLASLALLLAEPVLFGRPDRTPRVLVAPGVDVASLRPASGLSDARWQRLAPGFPTIGQAGSDAPARALPGQDPTSLSSLLREFDATLPAGTPLTVLVPPVVTGADAEQPVLSRAVDWRIVPDAVPTAIEADAPAAPPAIPTLMVRYAPEHPKGLDYLRAAGAAWQVVQGAADPSDPVTPVNVATASTPLDGSRLVWLVPGPLPDAVRRWVAAGGDALLAAGTVAAELEGATVIWRDTTGALARGIRLGRGRLMRLERELTPTGMPILLEPDFPHQLARLFAKTPPPPVYVDANAHAPRVGATPTPDAPRPLAPLLAGLIALLFVLERWMANGPRRRTVA